MNWLELLIGGLLLAAVVIVIAVLRTRWVSAKPNEWLLVIHNGRMRRAGIGLSVFRGFRQQVVRFPSSIQRLQFKAQQVTKEMQGIEVSGFVNWVVYREGDGPWKAYQNLEGIELGGESLRANANIARLAESIIRHRVANSTIEQVIANRAEMRNLIREEMQSLVKGWGVWLETVEITDVVILSQTLFEDLQAPFRQETHKNAEAIRMNTAREIEEQRIAQELALSKQRVDAENLEAVFRAQKQLELEREEEKHSAERLEIEKARLRQAHEVSLQRTETELELARVRAAHELETQREQLALQSTMTPMNLKMAMLDRMEAIYRALPVEHVKLVNLGPGQGVEALLTNAAVAFKQADAALDDAVDGG